MNIVRDIQLLGVAIFIDNDFLKQYKGYQRQYLHIIYQSYDAIYFKE